MCVTKLPGGRKINKKKTMICQISFIDLVIYLSYCVSNKPYFVAQDMFNKSIHHVSQPH